MPRLTVMLLTVALLALASLPAAPADARSRRPHCALKPYDARLAQNARFTAILRGGYGASTTVLYICSRQTGKRRVVYRTVGDEYEGSVVRSVRLHGSRIAIFVAYADHYGHKDINLLVSSFADRRLEVLPVRLGHVSAWAFGSHDHVAWIGDGRVQTWSRATHEGRLLDAGVRLRDVKLTDGRVTWRHGDEARSAPAEQPAGACALGGWGSTEVEVFPARGQICWRATGATTSVPASLLDPQKLDTSGPFVALARDGAIVRYDARDGTALTVPTTDAAPFSPLVDASGSLAWRQSAGSRTDIWVSDAGGTRVVDTSDATAPVVRDGSTIWWSPTESYTFQPPPRPLSVP